MEKLPFQPVEIGGIQLQNRFIRSATYEAVAQKGRLSDRYFEMYRGLSQGEVGLIITGYFCFSGTDNPIGVIPNIGDDSYLPELNKLTEAVHATGSRIMLQLNHAGSQLFYPPRGSVYGPSAVVDPVNGLTPKPYSSEQLLALIQEFSAAAFRAKQAGFDGVQIHAAHGYLISKFLSPVFNQRTDEYGGSASARATIIIRICDAIKRSCGSDFPVWVKLNCSDFTAGDKGLTENDFMIIGKTLAAAGIDAIEVSGGLIAGKHQPSRSIKHVAYHLEYAKRLANEVPIPIVLVGGLRRLETIEQIITETKIAAVSLSRALIREPGLIKRWKEGDRTDATCIACSGCYNPQGTTCYQELTGERKEQQKKINQFMRSLRAKETENE